MCTMKHNRFLLSLSRAALLTVAAVGTLLGLSSTLSSCGGGGSGDNNSITYKEFARGQKKIYLLGASAWMVMEGGADLINNRDITVQGYFYPTSGNPPKRQCTCIMTPDRNVDNIDEPMSGQYIFDFSTDQAPFSGANTFTSSFLGIANITSCEVSGCKVTLNFDARTWAIEVEGSVVCTTEDGTLVGTLSQAVDPMPSGRFEIGR